MHSCTPHPSHGHGHGHACLYVLTLKPGGGPSRYYNQAGDRNSSQPNILGECMGPEYKRNYSSILWAEETSRIVRAHDRTQPLFVYLAFQSVHNPYEEPPIDVNATFPEIVDYERRMHGILCCVLIVCLCIYLPSYR